MLVPILVIAGVLGGILLYEGIRSSPSPAPGGPVRCMPATTLSRGTIYRFGLAAPVGAPPITAAQAQAAADALVKTGRWTAARGWVRGEVSAPAFGWPPGAPDNAALIAATYVGPSAVVPADMIGTTSCTAAARPIPGTIGVSWDGASAPMMPVGTPAPFAAGPPTMHLHAAPGMPAPAAAPSTMHLEPGAAADPGPVIAAAATELANTTTQDPTDPTSLVHQVVVLDLRGLAKDPTPARLEQVRSRFAGEGQPEADRAAAALGELQSRLHLTAGSAQVGAVAHTGDFAQVCATIMQQAMQGGARVPAASATPLERGKTYYASWPVEAKLSEILWQRTTATPPDWLGDAAPGRAIGVLVYVGPDGGSDPGVRVLGAAPDAAQARAA